MNRRFLDRFVVFYERYESKEIAVEDWKNGFLVKLNKNSDTVRVSASLLFRNRPLPLFGGHGDCSAIAPEMLGCPRLRRNKKLEKKNENC
jgi:hypothetical protein